MIYVILGGPATGKGTRSKILADNENIPHISTGELLRDEAKTNKNINDDLANGKLVDDVIVNRLLLNRIKQDDCKNGFVLDGYPRKISQVYDIEKMLKSLNKEIDEVIELKIPQELAFRRILERKECLECGKVYGLDFPSKDYEHCDKCNGMLIKRSDDTEETLKNRIETYKELSKEITEYYTKKGVLKTIDASNNPEKILRVI